MSATARVLRASAPGKMMIAGEYAVLDGAEAVVAAVDRRVRLTLELDARGEGLSPLEVTATRALIEARYGAVPGVLSLDASALQLEGKKLGLGSSAANAAATAGLLLRALGRVPADQAGPVAGDPALRAEALELALEGHRAVAPDGSGADVAASVLGGFVRFRRLGSATTAPAPRGGALGVGTAPALRGGAFGIETHPIAWPSALHSVVVWTGARGEPPRTSVFIAKVQALATADPRRHRALMSALAAESERFVSALMAQDVPEIVECFHDFGSAMGNLGTAAGVPIVDDQIATVRELAQVSGGAAKPSGAGGGDVALALFSSVEGADAFRAGCARAGFEVLSILLGVPGERDEEQS